MLNDKRNVVPKLAFYKIARVIWEIFQMPHTVKVLCKIIGKYTLNVWQRSTKKEFMGATVLCKTEEGFKMGRKWSPAFPSELAPSRAQRSQMKIFWPNRYVNASYNYYEWPILGHNLLLWGSAAQLLFLAYSYTDHQNWGIYSTVKSFKTTQDHQKTHTYTV